MTAYFQKIVNYSHMALAKKKKRNLDISLKKNESACHVRTINNSLTEVSIWQICEIYEVN